MNLLSTMPVGIPIGVAVFGLVFLAIAIVSSRSNSTTQLPGQRGTLDNTGNVPFYKSGYFIFAVICFVAAIGIYIYMYSER